MNNLSVRHRRDSRLHGTVSERLGAASGSVPQKYLITDPDHRPDLRGQFAGQPVSIESGRQFVWLTDNQARFYLDQGVLEPMGGDAALSSTTTQ